jgi:hypothetical protein
VVCSLRLDEWAGLGWHDGFQRRGILSFLARHAVSAQGDARCAHTGWGRYRNVGPLAVEYVSTSTCGSTEYRPVLKGDIDSACASPGETQISLWLLGLRTTLYGVLSLRTTYFVVTEDAVVGGEKVTGCG